MNLSLLDPFVLALDCPETFAGKLRSGRSTALSFNGKGDLLASGRVDGIVVLFDIDTSGVARKLHGHTKTITSLSWSKDGRYLLSCSLDWKCILWDLFDGSRVYTVRFANTVFNAELHPSNPRFFLATLLDDHPVLVDATGDVPRLETLSSAPKRPQVEVEALTEKQQVQDAKMVTTSAIFSSSGDHVLAATNKGWLNIISTTSHEVLSSNRLSSAVITHLHLSTSGRDLVFNSGDRIIRTLQLPDLNDPSLDYENLHLEPEHKFQDIVNHLSWNHVTFSTSGEYVIASIYMNHYLYVWERGHGSLEKILEGPREELGMIEWHPHKPFLAACGNESGDVFLWSVKTPQKWSALAPDFAEVEENVEYVEREDEFDIHPIEEIHKRILNQEEEEIDVLTIAPMKQASEEDDFRMPVLLDIGESDSEDEVVAIGAGQYRRKSPGQGKEWAMEDEPGQSYSDSDAAPRRADSSGAAAKAVNGTGRKR